MAKRGSLTFTLNSIESRREMHANSEYLIAPVVAVREKVLNGWFLPYEEIAAFNGVDWEGRPLPVDHPKREGVPVTANLPSVMEADVIGRFHNVYVDATDRALKGEFWIEINRANAHAEGPAIIERIETNKTLEVSTAYFCDIEQTEGEFNGEPYYGIQRNLRPDHLALLPNSIGACSWQDGCGGPRVNQQLQVNSEDNMEKTQLVDQLIANEKTPWRPAHREMLMELSECELKKLAGNSEQPKEEPKSLTADDVTKIVANAINGALGNVVKDTVSEALKPYANTYAEIEAAKAAKKTELVNRLVAAKVPFDNAELEKMEMSFLERIADMQNVDYRGLGRPRVNRSVENEDDAVPAPPAVMLADPAKQ